MYVLLLITLFAIVIYSAVTGGRSYKILEQATDTKTRQKIYRSWIWESWLLFGVPSLVGIIVLLQSDQSLQVTINNSALEGVGFGVSIGLIAILIAVIVYSWRKATTVSRGDRAKTQKLIDASGSGSLIARSHEERKLAAYLSFAAGVTEELFFRLALPLLMVAIFGVEWLLPIIAVSVLLFGLAHAYQGISGVVGTALIGAIFMCLYVSTGSILLVILVHILIDMRATVALSWLAYGRKNLRG